MPIVYENLGTVRFSKDERSILLQCARRNARALRLAMAPAFCILTRPTRRVRRANAAEWRNWQTQQTQNLPGRKTCTGSTPVSATTRREQSGNKEVLADFGLRLPAFLVIERQAGNGGFRKMGRGVLSLFRNPHFEIRNGIVTCLLRFILYCL